MKPTELEKQVEKGQLIELVKDTFNRHGVKQKEDGKIITYFTPDSATDFVEDLVKELLTPQVEIEKKKRGRPFVKYVRGQQIFKLPKKTRE